MQQRNCTSSLPKTSEGNEQFTTHIDEQKENVPKLILETKNWYEKEKKELYWIVRKEQKIGEQKKKKNL